MAFSRILTSNGKLDIGQRLIKSLGSVSDFLVVLIIAGKIPVERDEWIMKQIRGSREERKYLAKTVRRGSRKQVEGLDLQIRAEIDGASRIRKLEKGREHIHQ